MVVLYDAISRPIPFRKFSYSIEYFETRMQQYSYCFLWLTFMYTNESKFVNIPISKICSGARDGDWCDSKKMDEQVNQESQAK